MLGSNDYPYNAGHCQSGIDPWSYVKGQCTSFAAWRMANDLGVNPVPRYLGDGGNWASSVVQRGLAAVDHSPRRGDVFCLPPGVNGAGSAGHVGIVLGVSGSSFTAEDYNWCNECCLYHQHPLPIAGTYFIHIGSLKAPPPPVSVCPTGYSLGSDGVCHPPPLSLPCPPGDILQNGVCLPPVVLPGGGLPLPTDALPGLLLIAGAATLAVVGLRGKYRVAADVSRALHLPGGPGGVRQRQAEHDQVFAAAAANAAPASAPPAQAFGS